MGDDKAPIRMHQAAPSSRPQPPTVTSETSQGPGVRADQSEARVGAGSQSEAGPHRVISDSDKSKQTNSQSNAVCDV